MFMTQELDPNKYHVLNPKQKLTAVLVGLFVLLIVTPFAIWQYYNFAINRPAQNTNDTVFEIKKGDTLSEISDSLYTSGLVNSKFLFYVYTRVNGLDKNLQAGIYKINPGLSVVALTTLLQAGTNDSKVTFLEGWRIEEFAREASRVYSNVDYLTFVKLAKPYEGYLYPDTYFFSVEVSEQEIVDKLLNTYKEKTKGLYVTTNLDKLDMSESQILTIASIVEREVRGEDDKKKVAGILIKRWKENQLIGADATTQYIVAKSKMGCELNDETCPDSKMVKTVQWWPQELTQDDLDTTNQYNTRKVLGLPPTPISSPSIDTIKAVMNFENTKYYYYLTDIDGNVHYAVTLEEHNSNVQKYIK